MNNSLEIKSLTSSFATNQQNAELNLCLSSAKRVALLGLNGAGKSSLIRLLVGESQIPSGSISFFSHGNEKSKKLLASDNEFKQQLGYQSDTMLSIANLNGSEYLHLVGQAKGLTTVQISKRIQQIDLQWPILNLLDQPIANLSKGNLQKLMISQAFLNQPSFLFFDEPCQSLDPLEQERFNQILKDLNHFELCLFSTHNVAHAIEVADEIVLIHHSKIIYHFKFTGSDNYLLVSRQPSRILTDELTQLPLNVRILSKQFYCIEQASQTTIEQLLKKLAAASVEIDFCLPEKQAIVPLFRLFASGEIDFDKNNSEKLSLGETG